MPVFHLTKLSVAAVTLLLVGQCLADDTKPAAESAAAAIPAADADVWNDPAFAQYVDPGLLRLAITDLDPAKLTDAALQFAEGERVLLRSHSAVSAEQLLSLAVQVAARKSDKAALARLKQAAKSMDNKALAAEISAASKLGAGSRGVAKLPEDLGKETPSYVSITTALANAIDRAQTVGSAADFNALKSEVSEHPLLKDSHKQFLLEHMGNPPASTPESEQAAAALLKLSGTSRLTPQIGANPQAWMTPMEKELLIMVNQQRQQAGAPPLQADPVLTILSRMHSLNMANQQNMDHTLNGQDPFQRMASVGIPQVLSAENIAFNQNSRETMIGWMNSQVHADNILNPQLTHIGMGVARGTWRGYQGFYFTQKFTRGGVGRAVPGVGNAIFTVAPNRQAYLLKDQAGNFAAKPTVQQVVQDVQPVNPNPGPNPQPAPRQEIFEYNYINANGDRIAMQFTFNSNGMVQFKETRYRSDGQFLGALGSQQFITVNSNNTYTLKDVRTHNGTFTFTFEEDEEGTYLYTGSGPNDGWEPLRRVTNQRNGVITQ